jgi:ATP-dependent Lon protease
LNEGIEILTGVKAGERKDDGIFEKDTMNYRVNSPLKEMVEKLKEFQFVIEKKE